MNKMRAGRDLWRLVWLNILAGLVISLMTACGSARSSALPTPTLQPTAGPSQTITLGDIDADEPAKKIKRFKPLADYLAEHLKEFGILQGRVIIARDIEEMARFLKEGTVDIYMDSPFPSLSVQALSGSRFILLRSKDGAATYWSTYVTSRGCGVSTAEDLLGKVMAL